MKVTNKTFVRFLVWFSIITSSFDIILTFDIASLTVRLQQASCLLFCAIAMADVIAKGKVKRIQGFGGLLILLFCNTFFLFNCPTLGVGIAYEMVLLLNILTVYSVSFLTEKYYTLEELLRWYVKSFVYMAVWGIVQRLLQFADIYLFVTQYNRINGFSYEPSYYTTYMIAGWVLLAYLFEKRDEAIFPRRKVTRYFLLCSIAMLLSTSKIGWMEMGIWIVLRFLYNYFMKYKVSKRKVVALISTIVLLPVLAVGLMQLNAKLNLVSIYFAGSGLMGTASHSYTVRMSRILSLLTYIKEHLWIGVSYGGVSYTVGRYVGIADITGGLSGSVNIFVEMIMAVGSGGFASFIYFLYSIMWKNPRKWNKVQNPYRNVLYGNVFGLLMQILALQMNQNGLRTYFWMSMAIVVAIEATIGGRRWAK